MKQLLLERYQRFNDFTETFHSLSGILVIQQSSRPMCKKGYQSYTGLHNYSAIFLVAYRGRNREHKARVMVFTVYLANM